jgi:hypothetical protein
MFWVWIWFRGNDVADFKLKKKCFWFGFFQREKNWVLFRGQSFPFCNFANCFMMMRLGKGTNVQIFLFFSIFFLPKE